MATKIIILLGGGVSFEFVGEIGEDFALHCGNNNMILCRVKALGGQKYVGADKNNRNCFLVFPVIVVHGERGWYYMAQDCLCY